MHEATDRAARIDTRGGRSPDRGEEGPAPVRVLYVAGAMRSGSTLLTRLLDEVDGFFGAGELFHFFGRALTANELCGCARPAHDCPVWGRVISRLVDDDLEGFANGAAADRFLRRANYGRHLPATIIAGAGGPAGDGLRRFGALLSQLYGAVRDVTGARVVVDASKLPAYGWLLRDLRGVRLTVVHLVRDARAVVHSWSRERRRPGAPDEDAWMNRFGPLGGGLLWSVSQAGAEILGHRVRRSLRVRYRDLTSDPEAVVRRILRAVSGPGEGLDPFASAEDLGSTPALGHLRGHTARLGEQHVLAGNPMRMRTGRIVIEEDRAWRERMPPARRRLVTALTLPFLRRYGMAPG